MEPQNNTVKYIIGIVIVLLVILALSFMGKPESAPVKEEMIRNEAVVTTEEAEKTPEVEPTAEVTTEISIGSKKTVEVVFTDKGFTPSTVTIAPGTTVHFTNQTSGDMWVGSNDHPSHTKYAGTSLRDHCPDALGTSLDQCGSGKEYSFTFTKVGTWGYHDHKNASMRGTVIVK